MKMPGFENPGLTICLTGHGLNAFRRSPPTKAETPGVIPKPWRPWKPSCKAESGQLPCTVTATLNTCWR